MISIDVDITFQEKVCSSHLRHRWLRVHFPALYSLQHSHNGTRVFGRVFHPRGRFGQYRRLSNGLSTLSDPKYSASSSFRSPRYLSSSYRRPFQLHVQSLFILRAAFAIMVFPNSASRRRSASRISTNPDRLIQEHISPYRVDKLDIGKPIFQTGISIRRMWALCC